MATKKRTSAKKTTKKASRRPSGGKVEKVMHEFKRGTLRSGRGGAKVKSRKQAIAIGLSEAREAGEDVPPEKPARKKPARKASKAAKKKAGRKSRT